MPPLDGLEKELHLFWGSLSNLDLFNKIFQGWRGGLDSRR